MDLIESLTSIIIPRWVKIVIICILGSLLVANMILGLVGITGNSDQEDWIEAGSYLLGILLPIFLVALVVVFSESGVEALRQRTHDYMTSVLPEVLKDIYKVEHAFYDPQKTSGPDAKRPVRVLVNLERGSYYGEYLIYLPDKLSPGTSQTEVDANPKKFRKICLRLDLNVTKVNCVMFFSSDICRNRFHEVYDRKDQNQSQELFENLAKEFPHTIAGAQEEGYAVNSQVLQKTLEGREYNCIVLVRHLDQKFLLSAQNRLAFAQDLTLMLYSFYNEAPELFEIVSAEEAKRLEVDQLAA